MSQAKYYLNIFGTERDTVNCPFYWKIGCCKYGEKCNRVHNRPTFSQTILIPNMYCNPIGLLGNSCSKEFLQNHFEEFYEDVFLELSVYGKIEELLVCNNVANHLVGNVYVKYKNLEDSQNAIQVLRGRYYGGKLLKPEFSPVTNFYDAKCRQFENSTCTHDSKGKGCNFLHVKIISSMLEDKLWNSVNAVAPRKRKKRFSRTPREDYVRKNRQDCYPQRKRYVRSVYQREKRRYHRDDYGKRSTHKYQYP